MSLITVRALTGKEPVIIQPYEQKLWCGIERLRQCEIYALPEGAGAELYTPMAWLTLRRRDVTFWPIDVWSAHVMTLIVQSLSWPQPPNGPMDVIRWAWGSPHARELGEAEPVIETVWKREQQAAAKKAAE